MVAGQEVLMEWDKVGTGWLTGCHLFHLLGTLISSHGCEGLLSGKSQ